MNPPNFCPLTLISHCQMTWLQRRVAWIYNFVFSFRLGFLYFSGFLNYFIFA